MHGGDILLTSSTGGRVFLVMSAHRSGTFDTTGPALFWEFKHERHNHHVAIVFAHLALNALLLGMGLN